MTSDMNDKLHDDLMRVFGSNTPQPDFAKWRQSHPEATRQFGATTHKHQHMTINERLWTMKNIRRIAAAIIVIAVASVGVMILWNTGGSGAQKAFAAAIDSVRHARTFSCKQITEFTQDGKTRVHEGMFMFKEPDRERHEWLTDVTDVLFEITITDYGKRRRLRLRTSDKTARLIDTSSEWVADGDTGQLELRQLDTSMRGQLLAWNSGGDVEDLGTVQLGDQSVRLLQSRQGVRTIKAWIDPQTHVPVQIVYQGPGGRTTFASIQIDIELSDDLFSVDLPENYHLDEPLHKPVPDEKIKLIAKMQYLYGLCNAYSNKHDGLFPEDLSKLTTAGLVSSEKLKAIQSDGPLVIRYRRPRADAHDLTGGEMVLYEAHEDWPEGGIWACFIDGHCEIIFRQERFEKLMR